MSSSMRRCAHGRLGHVAQALGVACALLAAGCSGDVTRFSYGQNGPTGSLTPPEPVGRGYGGPPRGMGLTETPLSPSAPQMSYAGPPPDYASQPPPHHAGPPGNYKVLGRDYGHSGGPPPQPYRGDARGDRVYTYPPPSALPPTAAYAPPARAEPAPRPRSEPPAAQLGETIEVQTGDTLFGLSRRHGVPVAALKEANGLETETLRPGQRLVLPGGGPADRGPPRLQQQAPARAAGLPPPPASPPPPAPERAGPGWERRYVMKHGDSLSVVARQHGVSVDELKRANGITDPTKVWAGTVLAVPGRPDAAAEPAPAAAPRVVQVPSRIINAAPEDKAAGRTAVATDAGPPPPVDTSPTKFRWPVRGRIVSGFGKRPDGKHNDGIDLAVPLGTDVHAAEAGSVAYAGNELKAYGNLVLIRHANGWVSAYGNADQIMVKQGDTVRRGQVIAKSGKTGTVEQPQLHFELRSNARPVDPLPHLAN